MKKKTKKKIVTMILTLVLASLLLILDRMGVISVQTIIQDSNNPTNLVNEKTNQSEDGLFEVVRVVDGDTVVVKYNGKNEKVRLIGIDTPESVHPDETRNTEEGKIASDYTKKTLSGKKVKLEFDVQKRDKYGRVLAYIYLDGIMYNKTLLKNGYAKVATYPPNVKYVEDFVKLQKEARNNEVGIWRK